MSTETGNSRNQDAVNTVVPEFVERRFREIEARVLSYMPDVDTGRLRDALEYANEKHFGQTRKSGEPYISHPVEVMGLVASMKLDASSLCAALLHDTVEDTEATLAIVEERFGRDVAELVDGLTKIAKISFKSREEHQAENIRKLIVAMSRDLRVIFVKLADRMHNIQTLGAMSDEKKERIGRETLEIYAPLANRLGINWVKTALEDESLKHLHPDAYVDLKARINQKRSERDAYINETSRLLLTLMREQDIEAEVQGRSKHFYSIWRKMERTGVDFDEIYDITAFRILVDGKDSCYHALGRVHEEWRPVAGRFKDYIAVPKPNGYRSLHTTVIGPSGERVEIQIRTHEMHRVAEYGVAAHWAYKEGRRGEDAQVESFNWIRNLVEAQAEIDDSREYLESVKLDLFDDEVFVFTPQGDVKNLPRGSSPLDFAYAVHSEVGDHCTHAKVNNRLVPLRYELNTGDVVEIITREDQHPREEWLDIVKSSRARSRIRSWIGAEKRESARQLGYEMLNAKLRTLGTKFSTLQKTNRIDQVAEVLKVQGADSLLVDLGYGKIPLQNVIRLLFPDEARKEKSEQASESGTLKRISSRLRSLIGAGEQHRSVQIDGMDGEFASQFARCCSPVPGEEIVGFVTRGRGVTIHKADCSRLEDLESERLIDVTWKVAASEQKNATQRRVRVRVLCRDDSGILSKMFEAFSSRGVAITEAHCRSTGDGLATSTFDVMVDSAGQLGEALKTVRQVSGVMSVDRVAK